MWLEVSIPKKSDDEFAIKEFIKSLNMSYGVIFRKAVLRKGKIGNWTRLYSDDQHFGFALEIHQAEDAVEMQLNFPAGDTDIEIFFMIIEKLCDILKPGEIYMNDSPVGVDRLSDLEDYYLKEASASLARIRNAFAEQELDGFVIFGSRFPLIFSEQDMIACGDDHNRFAFKVNFLQNMNVEYSDPAAYYLYEQKRNYALYPIAVGKLCVVPETPDTLFMFEDGESADNMSWIADFGYAQLRYEDFIRLLPGHERFDEGHYLINLSEEDADRMIREAGYNMFTNEISCRPEWGLWRMEGLSHARKVPQKKLKTEPINGYSHLAIFLRWCVEQNVIDPHLYREYPELEKLLHDNLHDLRLIVKEHDAFNGKLYRGQFIPEFGDMTDFCIRNYPTMIDRYADMYYGAERCIEEFQTEGYLFVPFDEEYYQFMAKWLSARWEELKQLKEDRQNLCAE